MLQGWAPEAYLEHLEDYQRAGFDLRRAALVGVGSICRRQHTDGAAALLARLHGHGLRLHGFGLKVQGLTKAAGCLVSADSMAWSFDARPAADVVRLADAQELRQLPPLRPALAGAGAVPPVEAGRVAATGARGMNANPV